MKLEVLALLYCHEVGHWEFTHCQRTANYFDHIASKYCRPIMKANYCLAVDWQYSHFLAVFERHYDSTAVFTANSWQCHYQTIGRVTAKSAGRVTTKSAGTLRPRLDLLRLRFILSLLEFIQPFLELFTGHSANCLNSFNFVLMIRWGSFIRTPRRFIGRCWLRLIKLLQTVFKLIVNSCLKIREFDKKHSDSVQTRLQWD